MKQRRWSKLRNVIATSDPVLLKSEYHQQNRQRTMIPTVVHYLCKCDPPLFIVEALVDANAEALYISNKNMWQPLHMACRYGASNDVINYLYHRNPSAVWQTDTNSGTPVLHLALGKKQFKDYSLMKNIVGQNSKKEIFSQMTLDNTDRISALEVALLENKGIDSINAIDIEIWKEREKLSRDLSMSELIPDVNQELSSNKCICMC